MKKEKVDDSQLFYFDHLTKTVKSVKYKANSWEWDSDGKGFRAQQRLTTSRWW